MSSIDDILEQCLKDILLSASSVDDCLARYPEHAPQLEPLLRTAVRVEQGSRVHPSPTFKARARARLTMHMQASPRRRVRPVFSFRRLTTALASVVFALFVTGTVYAQGVLPGDPFYEWKLTSERAWRLISADSVVTDLRIANRRINEMNVTVKDQARWERALEGYNEVRSRLKDEIDENTLNNILPPTDVLTYPGAATLTPEPVLDPQATATPTVLPPTNEKNQDTNKDKDKDKDKDQKDKKKQDQNNNNNEDPGKNKDKGSDGASTSIPDKPAHPHATAVPKIIPTIEIPPPAN